MKVLSIILIIAGLVDILISAALKIMHWPGINYLRYGGIILLAFGIVLLVLARRKSGANEN